MIKEHNRVVLTASLPARGLVAGDVGTVVHVYGDGKAYEVEFFTLDGHTADVVTVEGFLPREEGVHHISGRSATLADGRRIFAGSADGLPGAPEQ